MSVNLPPAVNYPSPLTAIPSILLDEPREGKKSIPVEIDWGSMGGTQQCVNFNLQNNATLEFSQICAISVDNSQCGMNVVFVWPDTSETTTIPAYAPKVIIPVFTRQTQFFVVGSGKELTNDVTTFSILNYCPPPGNVPFTVEQLAISSNNISATGAGTVNLLPSDVNGTVEAITITRHSPISTTGTQTWSIQDGDGTILFAGQFNAITGVAWNAVLLSLSAIHLRFSKGLTFSQSGTNVGGAYCINVIYRKP